MDRTANIGRLSPQRRGPRVPPRPPAMPRGTQREPTDARWQAPWRSRRPKGFPEPPAWPLCNRFARLTHEVIEEDPAYSQEFPKLPSRPLKTPVVIKTRRQPTVVTQEVSPTEADQAESVQPYGSSYFPPGKNAGKTATFRLETGCTTNLLSRCLFDTLGAYMRAGLESYKRAHGTLADRLCIPFYGVLTLPGPVRNQAIHETFIVSHLKECAILGMPFLENHLCRMDFQNFALVMAGKKLVCVDKFGRPLVGGVQVVNNCMVPGRSQATLHCKVNCKRRAGLRLVEGLSKEIQLANSLNWLDCQEELLVKYINTFTEPIKLPAGALVRKHSIQEVDVGPALETVAVALRVPP